MYNFSMKTSNTIYKNKCTTQRLLLVQRYLSCILEYRKDFNPQSLSRNKFIWAIMHCIDKRAMAKIFCSSNKVPIVNSHKLQMRKVQEINLSRINICGTKQFI